MRKLEESLGGQAGAPVFRMCFTWLTHMRGRQMEAHSVGSKTKKEKKNSLLQAHVSCACLQVQQLQDKKNGGDPWMCGGYKHTQAHAVAIFSLVAMRGQCYDILREPQLPPPSTTIPKILQWLPPRRNSFGDAAWIQEIIEIHSDKVWQYECSHLPEIKGLFGFKPGGNPRDIL